MPGAPAPRRSRAAGPMLRLSLCLAVVASLQAAAAALQTNGRQLLQQQQQQGKGYRLLHSMHCFARAENAFMSAADWSPSSEFAGTTHPVQHVAVPRAKAKSVLAAACQSSAPSGHLEFLFAVPPSCPLELRLLFADGEDGPSRQVGIFADEARLGQNYDVASAPPQGDMLTYTFDSAETGLLDVRVVPVEEGTQARVNGIQVLASRGCPAPTHAAKDTTEEEERPADEAVLVYRLACSAVSATPQTINPDLQAPGNEYVAQQETFVADVANADAASKLYKQLCMPAVDADSLTMQLPLAPDVTYEVRIFFTRLPRRSWSDIHISANGHPVVTADRQAFAPGPGDSPTTLVKQFELRSPKQGASVTVAALHGFPPVSGLEVHQVQAKAAREPHSILDRADGRIVVDCGSLVYHQTAKGEVLYPDTSAFTAAGLVRKTVQGEVAAGAPEHAGLVDAGAFATACQAPAGPIVATFGTQPGKPYKVTLYWAEFDPNAAVGTRIMDVAAAGAPLVQNVDVFASVGRLKTASTTKTVTPQGAALQISLTASVGTPMLSAIKVEGPQIDAAAIDRVNATDGSTLTLAAACGAAGPQWTPLDAIAGAGFRRYTATRQLRVRDPTQFGLYATHCFPAEGSDRITVQVPVVPGRGLRVVLHFAEVYYDAPGKRTFSVWVNQFKDLDIAKLGGPDIPVVREFVIVPKRPTLTIELVSQTGNAFLNGLEIFTTQAPADKPAPGTRSVAPAAPTAPAPVAADAPAPAPAPAPGPTPGAPLQFTVPEGAVACVPQGALMGPAGVLDVAPVSVAFGEIDPNDIQGNFEPLTLSNPTDAPVAIDAISCAPLAGRPVDTVSFFVVQFGEGAAAARVACGPTNTPAAVVPAFTIPGGGAQRTAVALFEPARVTVTAVTMSFHAAGAVVAEVVMSGAGGDPFGVAHTLHPVIKGPDLFVEPAAAGGAVVELDGTGSHTHGDFYLTAQAWYDVGSGAVISKGTAFKCFYPFGGYTVSHLITDNVQGSLAATKTITVAPDTKVPGTLLHFYYDATALTALPPVPDFAGTTLSYFTVPATSMPAAGAFVLRMLGTAYFDGQPTEFGIAINGAPAINIQAYIAIDGTPIATLAQQPAEGLHALDVRLPLTEAATVALTLGGSPITSSNVDVSQHPPIINTLSTDSTVLPGSIGSITGFLFRGAVVTVGGQPARMLNVSRATIEFEYPALAPGEYQITVSRDNTTSNGVPVTVIAELAAGQGMQGGPFAAKAEFAQKTIDFDVAGAVQPSRVLWCHGKLYASNAYNGGITEFTMDSNYDVVSSRLVVETPAPFRKSGKQAWSILGLACDPREPDATFRLYFTHSLLFGQNGERPTAAAPYYGSVYYVEPNAERPEAVHLISGLSVSNSDHVVTGLDFLHDGRLIVSVGSQTNAGIEGALGYLPENPSSSAIVVADINAQGFDGAATYGFLEAAPADALAEDPADQRFGQWAQWTNPALALYATGTRNPYGLKVGLAGNVMCTNNGPNLKFGPAMTGVDASGMPVTASDPETADALWVDLQPGCHLGAPNIARCRAGAAHECTYIPFGELTTNAALKTCAPDAIITSPIGGVAEFNSYVFGGVLLGRLYVASYKKHIVRFNPADGKQITDKEDSAYPPSPALDVVHAPGGVHIAASMQASKILVNYPIDATVASHGTPTVYDVLPNKALVAPSGPVTFTVGGANFDAITGPVTVSFGAAQAVGTVAGPSWITGVVPANPQGTCGVDVSVTYGTTTLTLPKMFCYLAQ